MEQHFFKKCQIKEMIEMENRRIKLTKRLINESFIELLQAKPFNKISVKEICDNADINRTTFYNYYDDQYDLLSNIEDNFINDINTLLKKYDFFNSNRVNVDTMLLEILNYIKDNKLIFLSLFETYDANFINRIVNVLGEAFIKMLQKGKGLNKKEAEYELYYVVYGILNVIRQWLLNDKKTSSKELVQIIFKINNYNN